MIKKDIYLIDRTPFRILRKKHYKTEIISKKGDYRSVDSSLLVGLNEGDYLIRSRMIGNGTVHISYLKWDEKNIRKPFSNGELEDIFLSDN
ncbi:MAG: hypothetical protein NTZ83_03940 [Candidatus Pacearchaeota archaeon]|nr:hypothetical protein [Candidatus Pacearchaeota archaeon]